VLHAHLAAPLRSDEAQLVGTPIEAKLDPELFQPDARCIVPSASPIGRKPIAVRANLQSTGGPESKNKLLAVSLGRSGTSGSPLAGSDALEVTQQPGIYEIWGKRKSGELEVQRYALNVDPEEGDPARVTSQQLAANLRTKFQFDKSGEIEDELASNSAGSWSQYILYGLIVLLLLEQLLAYSASYHPARSSATASASPSPLAQRAAR
jgi:hypothetical protein